MKKTITILLILLISITFSTLPSYALGFTISMTPDKNVSSAGSEVTITISTNNLNIGGEGMSVFSCFLEYDKSVFEEITFEDIKGLNNWSVLYNNETGKILLDNSNFITTDSDLCTITFKLKSDLEIENTEIKITSPQTSNNQIDIIGTDGAVTIYVKQLTSDIYEIDESNSITGVPPNSSVDEIKESVTLDTDLKTWANAMGWKLSNEDEAVDIYVDYDFEPENITEGIYQVSFSTEGREFKIHTTDFIEEGQEVGLTFEPEDIHVMEKMEF